MLIWLMCIQVIYSCVMYIFFFFFQAEDGIRDYKVTGVQTCALPILAAALVLDGTRGGTDAQVLAGIDWCVEQKVDVISMSLGGLVMDAETPTTYTEEIGRASCRERVEISVVAVSLKKKKKKIKEEII